MAANKTSFAKGPDPRRHQLTRAERRRGYENALNAGNAWLTGWVWRKVRGYYRARRQSA